MRIDKKVEQGAPDSITASCTWEQAAVLARFDHHRVQVGGRWGILISYPLLERMAEKGAAQEPLVVSVMFNPSPKHLPTEEAARRMVFQHPLAPGEVQEVVEGLAWNRE